MKTSLTFLLLLLLGCAPTNRDQIGVLHVPDDPTKVLVIDGRRLKGDLPVTFRNQRLYIGDGEIDLSSYRPTRKFAYNEFDFIRGAFAWQGPTLVVFTGPTGFEPNGRHISGGDRARKGIAEIEEIERGVIAAGGGERVLSDVARREISAYARSH
jgi:hypothetical protein